MSSYLCVHKITQRLPFTVYMSKDSKDYIMYTIDTFNAMLKGLKDYVMYTVWMHLMLCQKGQKIMLCWNKGHTHFYS